MDAMGVECDRGKPKQTRGRHGIAMLKHFVLRHRAFCWGLKGFWHCKIHNALGFTDREPVFTGHFMGYRDKRHFPACSLLYVNFFDGRAAREDFPDMQILQKFQTSACPHAPL